MSEPFRRVVMVGLMGSGKTAIGMRLAASLDWAFDDSDPSIEARHGQNVRELRESIGTDRMHALEAEHLVDALDEVDVVVAAAASVIDVQACRDAMRPDETLVLWLRARPETLAARFRDQAHRPWYGDDPLEFLSRQAQQRNPHFHDLADVIVDVDGLSLDEAVNSSAAALEAAGSTRGPR